MRLFQVTACLAALASPASALAQQPAGRAAAEPKGEAAAAALSEADRVALQEDLIWSGQYSGIANGEIGPRTLAAIKAFQKRSGGKETGVLSAKERADLAEAAKKRREAVGWRTVADAATGARLGVPGKLVPQSARVIGGSRWTSARGEVQLETFSIAAPGTTLQGVHEQQQKAPGRKVSYNVLRPDFFVLAGLQGLKKFYVRGHVRDGQVRGFSIVYDQAVAGTLDPVVVAMSSAFAPFPGAATAATPPPRRRVEYGSGAILSPDGLVVTTRELMEGCQVISLAGHGPAERVAEDAAAGLVLIRLYGARNLAALPLAQAVPEGTVTIFGVADPRAQGGGSAVSSLSARVAPGPGSRLSVDPVPGLGFAGAGATDSAGRLAGIVDLAAPVMAAGTAAAAPQATLIPAGQIRALLAQRAADAPPSAADPRAAVVRVICFRK